MKSVHRSILNALVNLHAKHAGSHVAAVLHGDGGGRLTYEELVARSAHYSAQFREMTDSDDSLAVVQSRLDDLNSLPVVLASLEEFAGCVPLDPRHPAPGRFVDHLRDSCGLKGEEAVTLDDTEVVVGAADLRRRWPVDQHPLVLMFTGGASGAIRAVVNAESRLLESVQVSISLEKRLLGMATQPYAPSESKSSLVNALDTHANSKLVPLRYLSSSSFATMAGWTVMQRALCLRDTVVLAGKFEPGRFLDAIEQEEVTNLGLSPTAAAEILRVQRARPRSVGSLLAIGIGGASCDPDLASDLEDTFQSVVSIGYGSTELGGPAIMSSFDQPPEVRHSGRGQPLPGCATRLKPVDGFEAEGPTIGSKPDGVVGNLSVMSPAMALSYTSGELDTDADGFWVSDDLASLDEAGRVSIVGRRPNVVLRGAVRIPCSEIERLLVEVQGIRDCAVVGYPSGMSPLEDDIYAFVVREDETARSPTVVELRKAIRDELGAHCVPRQFRDVPTVPRTPDGKIRHGALRSALEAS